jgi:hypothetical protein
VSGWLSCHSARFSPVPCPCSVCFQHPSDCALAVGTLPRWFTLLGGRLYEQCTVTITLGTLHTITLRQLVDNRVPTRGGVGRTHGSSRRTTKDVGYGNIFPKASRTGFFRRRSILRIAAARPCRSSGRDPPPFCVASSLAPRVDLKLLHGWRLQASAVP